MESIFGGLIEFESEKEFDEFLTKIDAESSISILEKAIEYAHLNNVFSVQETYIVYKTLKKIKDVGLNDTDPKLQQS